MPKFVVKTQTVVNHYDIVDAPDEDSAVDAALTAYSEPMFSEVEEIKSCMAFESNIQDAVREIFNVNGPSAIDYVNRIIDRCIIRRTNQQRKLPNC